MPGGDYRDALRERAGWVPEAGPLLDADGTRCRRARRVGRLHRRPAQGPRRRARRAALRVAHRSALEHDPARAPRGPRDAASSRSSAPRSSRRTCRASPFRAAVRIRHRAALDPGDRPAARRQALGRRRPTRRCGPRRPARPRSCTTATRCSAAAASRPRSACAVRVRDAPRRATAPGCSLRREPRAVAGPVRAGRHLPRRPLRARSGAAPAAGCRCSSRRRSSAPGPATRSSAGSGSTC